MLHDEPALRRVSIRNLLLWWSAAMLVALLLDGSAARALSPVAGIVKQSEIARSIKDGGHFVFVVFVAGFVWLLHSSSWRGAVTLILSAITSGAVYMLLRWPVGRIRPIKGIDPFRIDPFRQGLDGFLNLSNASFPSGHACLAFATAACMAWLVPRGRLLFFGLAALMAAERVAELAHYLSDVVASAALGILAFHIARTALQPPLQAQVIACNTSSVAAN
jgi:membrane-associated phospholipid phosphatase